MPEPPLSARDCAFLIAVPLDRGAFFSFLERNSGFLRASGLDSLEAWDGYELQARRASALLWKIRELGAHVIEGATLEDLRESAARYRVVGLLAYCESPVAKSDKLNPEVPSKVVELANGPVTYEQFIAALPDRPDLLLDLSMCRSAALGRAIRRRRPSVRALVGSQLANLESSAFLWLTNLLEPAHSGENGLSRYITRSRGAARQIGIVSCKSRVHASQHLDWFRNPTGIDFGTTRSTLWRPGAEYIPFDLQGVAGISAKVPTEPTRRLADVVQFTASCPPGVTKGASYAAQVWLHTAAQVPELESRIKAALPGGASVSTESGPELEEQTPVEIVLSCPDLDIPQLSKTVVWRRQIECATFGFTVKDSAPDNLLLTAKIRVAGMQIASIFVALTVSPDAAQDPQTVHSVRIEHAFASHASQDKREVLARIQGIQAIAPWLTIFYDAASLRQGERWEERIEFEIQRSDVFYLFWSRAAKKSKWVEWEWRLALKTAKGIECISPIPLEEARIAPPPPELAVLNFNDPTLVLAKAAPRRRSRQTSGPS